MKTKIYLILILNLILSIQLLSQVYTNPLSVDSDGLLPIDFNPLQAFDPLESLDFDIDGDGTLETLSFSTPSGTPFIFPLGGLPLNIPFPAATLSSKPNTSASDPITITFSEPLSAFSFNLIDPQYPIPETMASEAGLSLVTSTIGEVIEALDIQGNQMGTLVEAFKDNGDIAQVNFIIEDYDPINPPQGSSPLSQVSDLSASGGPVSKVSIPGPGQVLVVPVLRITITAPVFPFKSLKISPAVPGSTGVPTTGDFILLDNFDRCMPEICDDIDNDCDGTIDEGFDQDGDGFTTCAGDCDDTNADINPNAQEICDGLDNNCDGTIDEGFDQDGDGFTACAGDCDDNDANNFPGNSEVCDDSDNNCDGTIDEGFDQDNDGIADCFDNCLSTVNPDQSYSDCDGVGDVCDQWPGCDDQLDANNNGVPDCVDLDLLDDWECDNKGKKAYICHIPPGNPANARTLCVSKNAVPAHINNHGDYLGHCIQIDCGNGSNFATPDQPTPSSILAPRDFHLYPNPASNILHLELHDYLEQAVDLSIYNHLGQRVWFLQIEQLDDARFNLELNDRAFPSGVYTVALTTRAGTQVKQFVITK